MAKEQQEALIKRILTTEVKYVIGIAVFIIGVVRPYYAILNEIELIKQNHMAHMEKMQLQIQNLEDKYIDLKKENSELLNKIWERVK